MPGGFGGQQQPQQPGRAGSARLPNGKLGNNNPGWAFGGGVPMAGAGPQNAGRQLGGNVSFAQSLTGSQSATLGSQQGGQEDLFSPSSRGPPVQGGFRFGN